MFENFQLQCSSQDFHLKLQILKSDFIMIYDHNCPSHIVGNQIYQTQKDATGEKLSTFYLFQSISMAIQKGNAQCVTGCVKDQSSGLEGLFNFHVHEAEEL